MSVTPESSPAAIERWEVLDLLTNLIQKSLVVYEEDEQGQGRYRLLEPMRQYARDRLSESGDAAAARDRHRDWLVALAERARPHLQEGPEQPAWMDRLERERNNLWAALEWCREGEGSTEAGLRLVWAPGAPWAHGSGSSEPIWQRRNGSSWRAYWPQGGERRQPCAGRRWQGRC